MKIDHNLTSGVLYAFDHLPPSPRRLVRPISLSSIELSIIQAGSWIGSDWKVLAANKWSNLDILINPVQTLPLPGRLCDCEAQGKGKGVPIISSSFLYGKLRENCTEIPIKVTCFNLISFELSVQGKRGGKLDMIFNTYVREFKEISRQIYLEILDIRLDTQFTDGENNQDCDPAPIPVQNGMSSQDIVKGILLFGT